MQRLLFPLAAILALLLCSGCSDSFEGLAKEHLAVMKELVATLETVKDAESARAAKPKLTSLAEQMKDLEKRMNDLGTPSEADIEAMEGSLGQELEEVQMKLSQNLMRITFDPEIQKELSDLPSLQ